MRGMVRIILEGLPMRLQNIRPDEPELEAILESLSSQTVKVVEIILHTQERVKERERAYRTPTSSCPPAALTSRPRTIVVLKVLDK